MKKISEKFNYFNLSSFAMAIISLLTLFEKTRVFAHLQNDFVILQISLVFVFLILGLIFTKNPKNIIALHIFSFFLMLHCILNSWYLPLLEMAYFQIAIGISFIEYRKKYTFYLYAGFGLIGMLTNHFLQARYDYKLPEIQRLDLILVLIYCFILVLLIHNFITQKNKAETINLKRYFTIGLNSTRLIHDVKGLLATPMLQVDNAIDNLKNKNLNEVKLELQTVAHQLNKTHLRIYQLNLLCKNESEKIKFNINSLIDENLEIINFKFVNISRPPSSDFIFWGYKEKMNSAIFNILMNINEAFENQQVQNPSLDIHWRSKNELLFRSNTIFNSEKKSTTSTGLGFQIMIEDLKSVDVKFEIKAVGEKTEVVLHLNT